jgi:hypothetical protein
VRRFGLLRKIPIWKLLAASFLLILGVEIGVYQSTGCFYIPHSNPSSYTVTDDYQQAVPKFERPAVWVYVVAHGHADEMHLGFTPPELVGSQPGPQKSDWLQASDVVVTYGPITIGEHGHMVEVLRGLTVVSHARLHITTRGGGLLLYD